MQLVEVKDKKSRRDFIRLPGAIYKDDPNWIPHLERDIEAVFDPGQNPQFLSGEVCRWVLYNDNGKAAGRIAAFINTNIAYTFKQPTGGVGFFECINDRKAAFTLFDTCKKWLSERGMKAMDGPVNFGEKERFWGLLVDGFDKPPPYLMNYNPPYYREFFEKYGFGNYYNQLVYRINTNAVLPPILEKKYQRLTMTQGYSFEHLKLKKLDKYAEDFMCIYNEAWGNVHKNFQPMTKERALQTFSKMKDVFDEELILFIYHKDRPVAFLISIPELNELFRYVNGKLNLLGKLKFMYYRFLGKCRTIYGLVFGIVPEYQNRGLESALIMSLKNTVSARNRYKQMYITWLGDFNPKMIRIVEHIGSKKAFTLTTYRKLFDETADFERHPVID